jgi:signal transduction histidine kinase
MGMIRVIKQHPEITFYCEALNSKEFGQTNFELMNEYFQHKYSKIKFDGVLVTDNDALDFVIKFKDFLFPDCPFVFTGVSNPEDYPLTESLVYGYTENVNTDYVFEFVKRILPTAKKVLVLTDLTTTGKIYREDFQKQAGKLVDFQVIFPEVIDIDSVARMLESDVEYDAIYYVGIGQDQKGRLIDFVAMFDSISKYARVPLFANDPIFNGRGVLGGMYQSGQKQGIKASQLLIELMDSTKKRPTQHYFETDRDYFFDRNMLDKFGIPKNRLPIGSVIINESIFRNPQNLFGIVGLFVLLFFIIIILSIVNRRRKIQQRKSNSQINKIETQKVELENAHKQLNKVISELEKTNLQLNVSNQKLTEAKKKAEESDKLKSAFLANVSHEIRTPLNSIIGFSSLLGDPALNEETRKTYIDLIESNNESLLVLIDEIIDLSKIEAHQLALNKIDFSVDDLIKELFRMFNQSNKNNEIELRIVLSPEGKELFVISDRVRVKQIFINLISNAFKFTNAGTIEFGHLLSVKDGIVLYVKDSGIGISKEHHKAIFQRFRKLNENTGKVYRGTGLGLAITQKLVELLGGKIWLDSEPGKGTIFYFTLQGLVLKDISK